jgi:hypothetical protein
LLRPIKYQAIVNDRIKTCHATLLQICLLLFSAATIA